jgi:hypothetical protein
MPAATPRNLPTDFDDEITDAPVAQEPMADKDEDGIPYCVKHHCRMRQTSGGKKGSSVAYFACPVDGCNEKAKRIKIKKAIVPTEPHLCPRCHNISPRPVMERDANYSNMMYTILKCPCCGHKSAPMPRPEFVDNHARSRKMVESEDLGAR